MKIGTYEGEGGDITYSFLVGDVILLSMKDIAETMKREVEIGMPVKFECAGMDVVRKSWIKCRKIKMKKKKRGRPAEQ